MTKKYYEDLVNAIDASPKSKKLLKKIKKLMTKNFIICSIIGIIAVYRFFNLINFFFKLPFIILFGLFIGYILNILYTKYQHLNNLKNLTIKIK